MAFPEHDTFDLQRWIDDDGRFRNDMSYPYGFGRRYVVPVSFHHRRIRPIRVCPGRHFAHNSLYINLALLLWSFRIVERADAPIDTDNCTDSTIAHPAPFDTADRRGSVEGDDVRVSDVNESPTQVSYDYGVSEKHHV